MKGRRDGAKLGDGGELSYLRKDATEKQTGGEVKEGTGLTSSELGSSCYSSPCKNGGTCEDAEGSYRCLCPQNPLAYVGWNCEFLYEACGGHACPSELICSGTPGQLNYTCLCRPGQIGLGCNSEADMCETNTCPQPHFECITINSGYGCQCRNRESCQIQSSLCSSNPCHNNGTCTESAGQYICKCQLGHVGTHCEEDVDECASSPCQNGAICLDRVNEYSCFCVPGFQGHHCEIDINECASRPCQHNSTCLNQMDHYVCQCLPGYTVTVRSCVGGRACYAMEFLLKENRGMNCDVEIDECISDPCWNGGTCNDHIGLFTCSCMPGFEGVQCEMDINECQSQPCLNGGMCHDLVNSYFCDCHNTGFEGEHCELDILECASQPCQNGATCLEGVGRYSCDCWSGYVGKHCEEDVDECTMEPCFNGGQCYEKIQPKLLWGTYGLSSSVQLPRSCWIHLQMSAGFAGICTVNIDECESQPCQNGGSCMDLVNSYIGVNACLVTQM
uniref:Uncharacterized protein n=1 Tax=Sphaerodactylus townsendi TaxID=933632 RepID=A0ACB8EYY2_9SAUR